MNGIRLLLRTRPMEPGHGVFIRLGGRNGFASTQRFATSLGIEFPRVLTGSHVAKLAGLAGLDPQAIRDCSPAMRETGRKVALCGEEFRLGDWSTRNRRYCPACLASDLEEARRIRLEPEWYVSHRAMWDVRLITACPVHGVQLLGDCYKCGEELGWNTTNILRCACCRADLLAAPCTPMQDPAGEYVARRLLGQAGENDLLDTLSLSEAMRLCERLGQIEMVGAVRSLPRQNAASLSCARAVGVKMTWDVKREVLGALDKIIRPAERPQGLHGAYGWIYGEWLTNPDGSNGFLRSVLFDHAVRNGVISAEESRLGNVSPETITMTQTARRAGMGYKRARAMAAEVGIIPKGSRRSVAFTIDPKAVMELKATARKPLSRRDAARRLKTGKAQVADLLSMGLLRLGAGDAVFPDSVTRLLDSLIMHCCAGSQPDKVLSMAVAARNAAVPLWRIVQAVREGRIPSWRSSGEGLSQFRVRLCDVILLRAASGKLSIEAAARRMGVHHDCARAMARCGTLADETGLVTEEGIARFERQYVVGAKVAREMGRSPLALHRLLSKAGVQPAFDLNTHRQVIYLRSDIECMGLLL